MDFAEGMEVESPKRVGIAGKPDLERTARPDLRRDCPINYHSAL